MTALLERKGSLWKSKAEAFAQGVNTQGLMGAGIAVDFKHIYPDMYAQYKVLCKNGNLKPGEVFAWDDGLEHSVFNIASQDQPGRHARLEWVESGLVQALDVAARWNVPLIAMPRIGCGIGGLDWADVRDIIEHYAEKQPVDIEVWSL